MFLPATRRAGAARDDMQPHATQFCARQHGFKPNGQATEAKLSRLIVHAASAPFGMPEELTLKLLQERRELVKTLLEGGMAESWPRVRQQLIGSASIYAGRHVHTIWEGPSRQWLLPLPFEVLRDFVLQFGAESRVPLTAALEDSEPNVVGYALHALSEIAPDSFATYVQAVSDRQEWIHTLYGSFAWEGTLAEYGVRLHEEILTPEA